ncbi:MAG: peptide-methionine (R)-S-oxide reductase MsrB [Verrucomicrobiales bacterium]
MKFFPKSQSILPLPLIFLLWSPALRAEESRAEESRAEEPASDSEAPVIELLREVPSQPGKPVVKSDEEWKSTLTEEQYRILREAGTERANGKVYEEFKKHGGGTYHCAGCGAKLFSSKEKFESHCGWPSFYDPAEAENVKTDTDYLLGYARTEVLCAVCDGHLGHVFTGEGFDTPTDKRFCINGTVLKFVPFEAQADEAEGKGDSKGKDKSIESEKEGSE